MDVVEDISRVPTTVRPPHRDVPESSVIILHLNRIDTAGASAQPQQQP
jgi:hypothetical protein